MRTLRHTVVGVVIVGGLSALPGCGMSAGQYNRRGLVAYNQGAPGEALGLFEASLEKDPRRADTMYYIGLCHYAIAQEKFSEQNIPAAVRRLGEAVYYFNQTVDIWPGHEGALAGRAEALRLKGTYERALSVARWADQQAGPAASKKLIEARQLARQGRVEEALVAYRQAVAMEPDNAEAHAELGRFYRQLGDRAQAANSLTQAYLLNPAEPGVARELIELGSPPPTTPSPEP